MMLKKNLLQVQQKRAKQNFFEHMPFLHQVPCCEHIALVQPRLRGHFRNRFLAGNIEKLHESMASKQPTQ